MKTSKTGSVRRIIILAFIFTVSLQQGYSQHDNIYYTFTHTDTTYAFYGRFKIDARLDCVMQLCFNFQHIREMAADASKVELIGEGENWNKIKYTYELYPLYKNESIWYRKKDLENQRINFTLISSKNNRSFMPTVISSSGYYRFRQVQGTVWVEYFQQCRFTRSYLISFYLNFLKGKAVDFLHVFYDYSRNHCSNVK
ncbi:MAG TPA: hypothetical protein P5228_05280 [Bacteroidales bacterium]|nr:hypothetical protein [Bacteroidales bacterium]HRZ50252.1 hypothetical protein [Bacteroidales bacterium]